jgi:hypothetical protein
VTRIPGERTKTHRRHSSESRHPSVLRTESNREEMKMDPGLCRDGEVAVTSRPEVNA